jgi:two-component sensor histidine kinase
LSNRARTAVRDDEPSADRCGVPLSPTLRNLLGLMTIDRHTVNLIFDVKELDLTFEQMSIIAMLVIEAANNSQKHVFQQGCGSNFSVSLKALPDRRALLMIWDDGPGLAQNLDAKSRNQRLGFQIIRDLASELDGTFSVTPATYTEIIVEFPVRPQGTHLGKNQVHERSA